LRNLAKTDSSLGQLDFEYLDHCTEKSAISPV
jgi:hypothetical protein